MFCYVCFLFFGKIEIAKKYLYFAVYLAKFGNKFTPKWLDWKYRSWSTTGRFNLFFWCALYSTEQSKHSCNVYVKVHIKQEWWVFSFYSNFIWRALLIKRIKKYIFIMHIHFVKNK